MDIVEELKDVEKRYQGRLTHTGEVNISSLARDCRMEIERLKSEACISGCHGTPSPSCPDSCSDCKDYDETADLPAVVERLEAYKMLTRILQAVGTLKDGDTIRLCAPEHPCTSTQYDGAMCRSMVSSCVKHRLTVLE